MAGDGVDEDLKGLDGACRDATEVGALGEPAPDVAVGIFNGTLFPGGVSGGVVDF